MRGGQSLTLLFNRFARREDGSLTIFGLFTFVVVIVLAGIGVDIVRHEQLRTELQNTLDRAVLAAANLENTIDPKVVVTDYFAKAGLLQYLDDVQAPTTSGGRRVKATVKARIPTYFMKFASVDELVLQSHGTAEQGIADLEIALVLDVSGSMNDYSRLSNLSQAGNDFAQIIFDKADPDHVSVSVVPYATQVSPSATMFDVLNVPRVHHDSSCVNFGADDFATSTLSFADEFDPAQTYEHTIHFDPWYWRTPNTGLGLPVCDPSGANRVLAFSKSLDDVQSKIQNLVARGNTSIDVGVKWGLALLDPANAKLSAALAETGEVAPEMTAFPRNWGLGAMKVLVVMTDGQNTTQFRMPNDYRSGLSDVWMSSTGALSFKVTRRVCSYWYCWWATEYYNPQSGSRTSRPSGAYSSWVETTDDTSFAGDNVRLLEWPEVWARMTVETHAYARRQGADNYSQYDLWISRTRTGVEGADKDDRLATACQAAKDKGVLVFTIGFEAPDAAAAGLKACASSDAHYYDVDGLELADAFAAIATKVTELRLVE